MRTEHALAAGLALALLAGPATSQVVHLYEDFDAPGTTWAATIFSDEHISGVEAFTREPLSAGMGAPDTVPPLPINAGGDLEGRYSEGNSGGAFALTADVPGNTFSHGAMRGFVAIGAPDPFGSQSVAFLLRASLNPTPPFGSGLNAYTAHIARNVGYLPGTIMIDRRNPSQSAIRPAAGEKIASVDASGKIRRPATSSAKLRN